jgi:hypothetical protein
MQLRTLTRRLTYASVASSVCPADRGLDESVEEALSAGR